MKESDNNVENKEADYIKSVLTEDKTKALIGYAKYYFMILWNSFQRK